QREEGEIAPAERRAGVGDDGAQARNPPARADERRRRGVLPALELGDAERREVAIEERPAAIQHREQASIDLVEGPLEGGAGGGRSVRRVGAPRERQHLPRHAVEMGRLPDPLERRRVSSGEQPLQSVDEPAETAQRVHLHEAIPASRRGKRRLSTSVWKTGWKSCGRRAMFRSSRFLDDTWRRARAQHRSRRRRSRARRVLWVGRPGRPRARGTIWTAAGRLDAQGGAAGGQPDKRQGRSARPDRKSTRLNSSHVSISYAVFCLKKKKEKNKMNSKHKIY